MTETAEQTAQDQGTVNVDEQTINQEKERLEKERLAREAEALRIRQDWLKKWDAENVSSFMKPRVGDRFGQMWQDVDPTSLEFAAGVSNISKVKQIDFKSDPKLPPDLQLKQKQERPEAFEIKSKFGSNFSYIRAGGREFIGQSAKQAGRSEMNQQTADDIALLAVARGWTHVNASGTEADRDKLWLAAQKYGLIVENHNPSPEAQKAYEDYKASKGSPDIDPAAGLTGEQRAPSAASNLPVQVISNIASGGATAKPREEDITDAEFEEIKPAALTGPQTRFLLTHDKGDDGNKPGPSKPAGPNGP